MAGTPGMAGAPSKRPVSVVVPVHGHIELTARCLASVPDWAEVVVVDDGSEEDVRSSLCHRFPGARFMRHASQQGFATAANTGLSAATGEVRVVLNSDARFTPGALEALVGAFGDQAVGIAGPRLVFPGGTHQISAAAFPTPLRVLAGSFALNEAYRVLFPRGHFPLELGMARLDHGADHDVDWVVGACIAIRDRCLGDTGGYDPGYPFYVEETDLCWRARAAGWRVRYMASAVVEHEGGASSALPGAQARSLLTGEARFMARAYGEESLRRWWASRVLGSLVKGSAFGLLAPFSKRMRRRAEWQWGALTHLGTMAIERFRDLRHR